MKCDICGSNKVLIHIKQITDNEETDIYICAKCAREKGIGLNNKELQFNFQNFVKNFGEIKKSIEEKDTKKICDTCKKTLDEIKKTCKVGCSKCYVVFRKPIILFLMKNSSFSEYKGKFPIKINILSQKIKKRNSLEKLLYQAVKEEKYEEAAYLRDKIAFIKKQIEKYGQY